MSERKKNKNLIKNENNSITNNVETSNEDAIKKEIIDTTQELNVEEIKNAEENRVDEVDNEISEEDEDLDDEDDDLEKGTKVVIGLLSAIIVVLVGVVGVLLIKPLFTNTTPVTTSETSVVKETETLDVTVTPEIAKTPTTTASPKATDETKQTADSLTTYQKSQLFTAVKNALKECYNSDEYVIPTASQMKYSGTASNPTITFNLELADGSKKEARMKATLDNSNNAQVIEISVGNRSKTDLINAKNNGENAKFETKSTPTPSATPDTTPKAKSSYDVSITNSVEITLEVSGEGTAYVVAVDSNGKSTEIARQDYSGGVVTTTQLEEDEYTLTLYASDGCKYSWEYSTN